MAFYLQQKAKEAKEMHIIHSSHQKMNGTCYFAENHTQIQIVSFPLQNPTSAVQESYHGNSKRILCQLSAVDMVMEPSVS